MRIEVNTRTTVRTTRPKVEDSKQKRRSLPTKSKHTHKQTQKKRKIEKALSTNNMSNHPLNVAIELNNVSAEQIINGKFTEAVKNLGAALQASKQLMALASDIPSSSSHSDMMTLDDCMRQGRSTNNKKYIVIQSAEEVGESTNDTYTMYSQPIHVQQQQRQVDTVEGKSLTIDDDCDDSLQFDVVSTSILFNLALAHHLSAKHDLSSTTKEAKLNKAARLYELASNLEQKRFEPGTNPLFMMTIVNNLGAIYHDLGQQENSKRFFQHLLSTMLFITEFGKGDEDNNCYAVVPESMSVIFFGNVMHLIFQGGGKNYCTAAAA